MFVIGPFRRVINHVHASKNSADSTVAPPPQGSMSLAARLRQLLPILLFYTLSWYTFRVLYGGSSSTELSSFLGLQRYLFLWAFIMTNAFTAVIIVFSNLVNRPLKSVQFFLSISNGRQTTHSYVVWTNMHRLLDLSKSLLGPLTLWMYTWVLPNSKDPAMRDEFIGNSKALATIIASWAVLATYQYCQFVIDTTSTFASHLEIGIFSAAKRR